MSRKIDFTSILMGIAIGDAYGAGLEFQDKNWIREHIDFSKYINTRTDIQLINNDWGDLVPNFNDWDYTDDTEMSIGCIKAICSKEELTTESLLYYWEKEYELDKKRKGIGRHGHGSMRWVYSGEKTIEEVREFQKNRNNPGNGPTMRAIPFGLVDEEKINYYAQLNANATHPNPKAIASSICIARASEFIIVKNGDCSDVIDYCLPHIKSIDLEFFEKLDQINGFPLYDELDEYQYSILCGNQPIRKPWFPEGIIGLPSDAMLTALSSLYILKQAASAFEGLKMSIRLGGDVDSIASICCGILAGRFGLSSIPDFMKNSVEGIDYLKSVSFDWEQYYLNCH